jgi:hypothetical protein
MIKCLTCNAPYHTEKDLLDLRVSIKRKMKGGESAGLVSSGVSRVILNTNIFIIKEGGIKHGPSSQKYRD